MTSVTVSHPNAILHGTIRLPSSKSISNRALILQQLTNIPFTIENSSTADDTLIMQQALDLHNGSINLKNAGTCMRFLTAYFAATENTTVTLLCDERMEQRPIKALVETLQQLGADITYMHKEGFPPLSITGKKLKGGSVNISASASSQYASALMMIAPLCEEGLTIHITGNITSLPYIEMTAQMMKQLGFDVRIDHEAGLHIEIPGQGNKSITRDSTFEKKSVSQITNFFVEPDWSAASYWYEMAALSKECDILLEGLTPDSLQGDAVIHEYMEIFGVTTTEEKNGIRLRKEILNSPESYRDLNLNPFPDLAPALAVTAAALNTPMQLTGLQNLAVKESNRLEALQNELTKLGFDITVTGDMLEVKKIPMTMGIPVSSQQLNQKSESVNPKSEISTYNDHRMAMAFAPLALVFGTITIEHPEVVEKSYPHFWEDLKLVGFRVG